VAAAAASAESAAAAAAPGGTTATPARGGAPPPDGRLAPESLRVAAATAAGRPPPHTSVRLSVRQQKLAEAARARVRAEMQSWMADGDAEELVGAPAPAAGVGRHGVGGAGGVVPPPRAYMQMSGAERAAVVKCARCCGKGYLSCLACAD